MFRLKAAVAAAAVLLVLLCPGGASAAGKTVGVIFTGDLPRYQEAHRAFVSALARAGFDQSKVSIYVQTPNPDPMSWANSARKFAGVGVDVIVAYGAPAALAAVREAHGIPVVFAFVYDPALCGVKKSNSTGVSSKVPMVTLLKTMKSISPYSKLGVLYNTEERDSVIQYEEAGRISGALGFQVRGMAVKSAGEVRPKAARLASEVNCLLISCSAVVDKEAGSVISAANRSGIPTLSQVGGQSEKGALLALAPSSAEQGVMAAQETARILRGESPASIGVEGARKIDLVLNLKAASALNLKVPFDVLNAATKVIK